MADDHPSSETRSEQDAPTSTTLPETYSESDVSEVDDFIQRVCALPLGLVDLTPVLAPSLAAEERIRRLFAALPNDPLLGNPTLGLLDIFGAPEELRTTRSRLPSQFPSLPLQHFRGLYADGPGTAHEQYLYDCLFSRHIFALDPTSRRQEGSPPTVADIAEFMSNWDVFTSGHLRHLDWKNVVAAGGSVLACLQAISEGRKGELFHETLTYSQSDIDLFIWGLNEERAFLKMVDIFVAIKSAVPWDTICVRKKNTITVYTRFPYKPVQIILRLYHSPAEILAGFDVDAACCLYDGNKVWASPRGVTAMMRQANTVDISRRSPSYEFRLGKYSQRGFEVYIPDLRRDNVREQIYDPGLARFPNGLARLLVLERINITHGLHYEFLKYPEQKIVGKKVAKSHGTLVDALQTTGYDANLIQIPYGPRWNAQKIMQLGEKLDNSIQAVTDEPVPHFHSLFVSDSMVACFGNMCPEKLCPEPLSPLDRSKYITGPLEFMTDNPGRQLISGSFNPIDDDAWELETYR